MMRTAHNPSRSSLAAKAFSIALSATLALGLVPAAAFAAEATDANAPANGSGEALVENSWRYDDGELIDESVISADAGGVSLLSDEPAIVDNPWTWQGDGYINPYGDIIPYAKLKGIDVSEHQGVIDWERVANESDIDFAIIRCGYGSDYASQDDDYWVRNVTECAKNGIPFGVYLYSYATNVEMARSEVQHVLRLLDQVGYTPTYPIYLDLEDSSIIDSGIDAAGLAEIADVFCTSLENEGYMAGVYANLNWWNNYLTDPAFDRWERWVAQYNVTCDYRGSYTIWQCTSSGTVPGIEGRVDLNFDRVYRGRSYGAYYDVQPTEWYVERGYFDYVVDEGLMQGETDWQGRETGYFRPGERLTRAQFATILYRYACPDATDTEENYADDATGFDDAVSGMYYTAAINWAYKNEIMTGYKDGNGNLTGYIGPDDYITRQDVATMIYRYAQSVGADMYAPSGALGDYPDANEIADYAVAPLCWCCENGIFTGVETAGGYYLVPQGHTLRSEMTKVITVLTRDVL